MAQTTGIGFPYEPPENPQMRFGTTLTSAQEAADTIIGFMKIRG